MKYYKLDKDTKAYLKRMAVDGIKTPADIYSVNDFIVGLKDYSIWGDVLDGWVMRSTQNAGTGSRVYSLKDNRYNGTLENGGTWTANGIYLRGDGLNPSQKIRLFTYNDFPNGTSQYGISVCGVVQPMNWSSANCQINLLATDSIYIETKFQFPYEQTLMSHCYKETIKGRIHAGVLLMTPTEHNRFDFYEGSLRKEF
jgi:hypothetical protein